MATNNAINSGTFPSLVLSEGGLNANLTANNGGIFYSSASAGAILAGTATANQVLRSGSSTTPAWTTATYPATTAINTLLYSSATSVISALATANSAALVTTSTGVPGLSGTMTNGQLVIGSTSGTPTAATLTPGGDITFTNGAGSITVNFGGTALPTITTNYQVLSSQTGTAGWYSNFYENVAKNNLFIGTSAGNAALTTGTLNTFVGDLSGTADTSGAQNTGFGYNTLHTNITHQTCTAIGAGTLALVNSSNTNAFVGAASGANLTTTSVSNSTAFGYNAINTSAQSSSNTAIGYQALNLYSGSGANVNNTAIGSNAAAAKASYTHCVFLGNGADASVNALTNDLVIGFNATVAVSNQIVLGNSSHTTCTIFGIDGQTSALCIAVLINASNVLGTTTSSVRFKQDIENMKETSSRIWNLRPIKFSYKSDPTILQYGLIAEEVEKIMPELIVYDQEGKPLTIRYQFLEPMILNEMKKLRERINRLNSNLGIDD